MIARITPGLSYLIPLFLLFQWLGLLGTLWPQIIIHLVVTVPIVIWIMIGYFETMPVELEEAALIDGATTGRCSGTSPCRSRTPGSRWRSSWRSSSPGTISFSASCWPGGRRARCRSRFIHALTFEQVSWGPLAAAALAGHAPVLLLTLLVQRQIVAGLTAGGVKGG